MSEPLGSDIVYNMEIRTDENGKVECVLTYKVKRTFDYKEWEEREIKLKTYGKDFGEAIASANLVLNTQLTKCNFDLFTKEQKDLLND